MKLSGKIKLIFSIFILITLFIPLFIGIDKNNVYVPEDKLDKRIINFTGNNLFSNDKFEFKKKNSNHKFTIINIWSSWCIPCRNEHRFISNFAKFNNVYLIGLNYKDKINNAKSFLSELGNPYDIVIKDYDGLISIHLGAFGVPETYVINDNGYIIYKFIGPIDENKFKKIQKIIKL